MVAIGGRDQRDARNIRLIPACANVGGADLMAAHGCKLALQQPQRGIGTAQRLEAAKPEARAFILVMNAAKPKAGGQRIKPVQRSGRIARPCANFVYRGCKIAP